MHEFSIQQTEFHKTAGIKSVRETVFIQEQRVPEELEWDQHDAKAIHVIAVDTNNHVIGTARLLTDGHIGRMAVLESWRKHGVGSAMLQKLLLIAKQLHLTRVFLHAQTSAIGFYEQHGFNTVGEEFMDAGIPHRYMQKDLAS